MKKFAAVLFSCMALILFAVLPAATADTLILPDSLTVIGEQAFYGTDAETVILPEGVTEIGDGAFGGSASLRVVYVPEALMGREQAALQGSPAARFVSLSEDWGDQYDYSISDGGVTITKYKGTDTSVVIPPVIEGCPVIAIGQNAFKGKQGLVSVSVPEGVGSIDSGAFADCTKLTQVSLPSTLTALGSAAFAYCGSASSEPFCYELPDNLAVIQQTGSSSDTFYNCNAVKVVTPGSATAYLLSNPDYVMAENAYSKQWFTFKGHEDFRYLYFADTVNGAQTRRLHLVKYTGSAAEVSVLPVGSGPESLSVLHQNAFKDSAGITKVTIPEGIEVLGASVFQGCTSLTEIAFPDSLREIHANAFTYCGSNTSEVFYFDLPDHLTYIKQEGSMQDAFYNCNAVRRVTPDSATACLLSDDLPAAEGWWSNRWFTFERQEDFRYLYAMDQINGTATRRLHLIKYAGSDTEVAVPQQESGRTILSAIHANVFKNCTGITKVTIPEGVESLGASAFQGCASLADITFPATLREIGSNAFTDCGKNITGVFYFDLPDDLTYIQQSGSTLDAFYNCNAVRRVTPGSATARLLSEALHTSEGWWADRWFTFRGHEDFRYLYFAGEDGGDADGCGLRLIKYTGQSNSVTVPVQASNVPPLTSVHTGVFSNNTTLTELVLPDTITLIKAAAFRGCTHLSDIHIPASLRKLEENVFTDCAADAFDDVAHAFPTYIFPMKATALDYLHSGSSSDTFYHCSAEILFLDDTNEGGI